MWYVMGKSSNSLLNSKLAVTVLHMLSKKESYGSEIAREIDKSQTSVDRIIQNLLEKDFIKKGKRTQAQYYEVNLEGIVNYWFNELLESSDNAKTSQELLESSKTGEIGFKDDSLLDSGLSILWKVLEETYNEENTEELLKSNENKIKSIAEEHFSGKLDSTLLKVNPPTLNNFLFDNFFLSIIFLGVDSEGEIYQDYPYLTIICEALSKRTELDINVKTLELALRNIEDYEISLE